MAIQRGFQEVLNGNANGAGIVLPDSQTENFATDQIIKNGLNFQRQALARKAALAQTNKDFATNQLKINPTIQYRAEVNGLAQKWYDQGVNFRQQGFNPFNPDYTKPDQVAASQQYLSDKRHIESLSDLAKEIDTNYNSNQKEVQDGKLDGWDDYQKKLTSTSLQDLEKQGGINAISGLLHPRYNTATVDQEVKGHIVPQHEYTNVAVPGMPGVFNQEDSEYIDGKQARNTAERAVLNQPGATGMFTKIGVGDPNKLYTKGGHYMTFDPNDKSDLGSINQPLIAKQMVQDYLTNPDLIRQLPDEVKQNILNSKNAVKLFNGGTLDPNKVGDAMLAKPYDASEDPAFKAFIMPRVDAQLKKEADYNSHIVDAVSRNTPELKDSQKYDSTLSNWNFRKQQQYISQRHLALAEQRLSDKEKKDADAADSGSTPVNMNIPYLGGKANVNANNYVPISVPNKNFAGVPAYSLTGGKPVKALESSGDYSVVGVGNFPFVNDKYKGTGAIAQPDFSATHPDGVDQKPMIHVQKKDDNGDPEDFLIPYDKLPENIKNSKPIKQALSKFRPATGQSPAQTPVTQKSKKTTDLSNIFGGN